MARALSLFTWPYTWVAGDWGDEVSAFEAPAARRRRSSTPGLATVESAAALVDLEAALHTARYAQKQEAGSEKAGRA